MKANKIQLDRLRAKMLNPFSPYNIRKEYIGAIRQAKKYSIKNPIKPLTSQDLGKMKFPYWDTHTPVHFKN